MAVSGSVATAAPAGASATDLDAAEAQPARRRSGRRPPRLQQKERCACSRAATTGTAALARRRRHARRCVPARSGGGLGGTDVHARPGGSADAAAAVAALWRRRGRPAEGAPHTRARSRTHGDGTRGAAYPHIRAAGSVARLCPLRRAAAPAAAAVAAPWRRRGRPAEGAPHTRVLAPVLTATARAAVLTRESGRRVRWRL